MSLKIIFAGTPSFAVPTFQRLLDSSHYVVTVCTKPDRPAGRGQKITESPVKSLANRNNIPIIQAVSLRDDEKSKND